MNSMLSYSGLSDRFWGKSITVGNLLNRVPKKEQDNSLWIIVQKDTKHGIFESLGLSSSC